MKKESNINFYFEADGEDLADIIDELLLKLYLTKERVCINE